MITPGQDVRINVHGLALQLPSRAATALALVINELVQNALEHAFSGQEQGQIDISLGHSSEEFIILVRDNGRGLPEEIRAQFRAGNLRNIGTRRSITVKSSLIAYSLAPRLAFVCRAA